MKKFTKGALITALVFVILGFTLCVAGAGIGSNYSTIIEMIRNGELSINLGDFSDWSEWDSETTEEYTFTETESSLISKLDVDIESGSLIIKEVEDNQGVKVEIKYRKENSKRNINVYKENDTFKIEESGYKSFFNNDDVCIILQIPADMEFTNVDLRNSAGEITIENEIKAENFSIIVDAGECNVCNKLKVSGTLYAEVGAGEIDFDNVETQNLELDCGVGEINIAQATAKDVDLDCGVGEINITLEAAEEDYSYSVDCGIGEVSVGESNYSGLGTTKEIKGGRNDMNIDCGIGEVTVEFTK